MRIDCLSVSKYSAPGKPGDDVPVLLPGQCFAVFDGATDVKGTTIAGAPDERPARVRISAAHAPGHATVRVPIRSTAFRPSAAAAGSIGGLFN